MSKHSRSPLASSHDRDERKHKKHTHNHKHGHDHKHKCEYKHEHDEHKRAPHNEHTHEHHHAPMVEQTAAVITVSDRSSEGIRDDTAGPAVCESLRSSGYHVVHTSVVPDDQAQIEAALRAEVAADVALCVTTGGTGMGPRDVTPEATQAVCDRLTPGLAEAMRSASAHITPMAWISRAVCGIAGQTLVINVPGSPKSAVENLESIRVPLAHGLLMLRSAPSRQGSGATDLTTCRYALFDFDETLANNSAVEIVDTALQTSRALFKHLRAAGWQLGVVTAKDQEHCDAMLREHDIRDAFACVVGKTKPEQDRATLIARAMKELHASADLCVMVGDRSYDIEAAAVNGIASVGVHCGATPRQELEQAGVTVVVDSVDGLSQVLLGMQDHTA